MQAVASNIIVGSQVWVEDPEIAWIDGDVVEIKGADIKIKLSSGKDVSFFLFFFFLAACYMNDI